MVGTISSSEYLRTQHMHCRHEVFSRLFVSIIYVEHFGLDGNSGLCCVRGKDLAVSVIMSIMIRLTVKSCTNVARLAKDRALMH